MKQHLKPVTVESTLYDIVNQSKFVIPYYTQKASEGWDESQEIHPKGRERERKKKIDASLLGFDFFPN